MTTPFVVAIRDYTPRHGSQEYGLTEMRWLAPSVPGTTDSYLFNPVLVWVEILDHDGNPVPPGTPGRLVLTDLQNHAMPLIRYDTGDVAVPSNEGHVGGFRLVNQILGRASELLTLPSGRILSAATLGHALFGRPTDFGRWVRFFQCTQTGENELELRVVWNGDPHPGVRNGVAEALRRLADPDTVVRLRDVDRLERLPSGKVWLVRRKLPD